MVAPADVRANACMCQRCLKSAPCRSTPGTMAAGSGSESECINVMRLKVCEDLGCPAICAALRCKGQRVPEDIVAYAAAHVGVASDVWNCSIWCDQKSCYQALARLLATTKFSYAEVSIGSAAGEGVCGILVQCWMGICNTYCVTERAWSARPALPLTAFRLCLL